MNKIFFRAGLFALLLTTPSFSEDRGVSPSPAFVEYAAKNPYLVLSAIVIGDDTYGTITPVFTDSMRSPVNLFLGEMRRCSAQPFDTTIGDQFVAAINSGNNRLFRVMTALYGQNDSLDIVEMLKACPFDPADENPDRSLSELAAWVGTHSHNPLTEYARLRMIHCYSVIMNRSTASRTEFSSRQKALLVKLSESSNPVLKALAGFLETQ